MVKPTKIAGKFVLFGGGKVPGANVPVFPTFSALPDSYDAPKALGFHEAAARGGYAQSMHELGVLYYTGDDGVECDQAAAVYWFREAAQRGVSGSMYLLAACLLAGSGTAAPAPHEAEMPAPRARHHLGDDTRLAEAPHAEHDRFLTPFHVTSAPQRTPDRSAATAVTAAGGQLE